MITKITKLKNFGIFHDFSWNKDIPEFKRFNLIYGWNRSGKTLLSRIFTSCEKKSTTFKEYPKKDRVDGIFEIKTDTDFIVQLSDGKVNPKISKLWSNLPANKKRIRLEIVYLDL